MANCIAILKSVLNLYLIDYTEMNSKRFKNLNVKKKTQKTQKQKTYTKENIGELPSNLETGKSFLFDSQNPDVIKDKTGKLRNIKKQS